MKGGRGLSPKVHLLVTSVGMGAVAVLAATLFALAQAPPSGSWALLAGVAAFTIGYAGLEARGVTFEWRGHRVTTSITEAAIYLGLVALPLGLLPTLTAIGLAAVHLRSGRPAIKGVFNIGRGAISVAVAVGTTAGLLALHVDPLLAAAVGTLAYSVFSEMLVATLFAFLDDVPSRRVYFERFLASNTLALALGVPIGIALVALWGLHPLAILAVVPLAFLADRAARLQAQSDRELTVRNRLADDARSLVGTSDEALIAQLVLKTCGDLLNPSRARLELASGATYGEEFDESGTPLTEGISVALAGRDGRALGTLRAWERPLKRRYGPDDRALLALVGAQATNALEGAHALDELAAQRDVIAKQEKLSALGALMAGVAHEINNPLTSMKLRVDVSRMGARKILNDPTATARERTFAENEIKSLDTFQRGIDRLATLCASLKSAAKPGDGKRAQTDLHDIAAEVVTIVRAVHKEVAFEVPPASAPTIAWANASEVHQVLLNLVKNAAEAVSSRPDPNVAVSTGADATSAWVEVRDNGPGIPDEVRSRLFTPFATSKKDGTGLGLSLSRQIVLAHGGDLDVETSSEGTTFRVRLPREAPSAAESLEPVPV